MFNTWQFIGSDLFRTDDLVVVKSMLLRLERLCLGMIFIVAGASCCNYVLLIDVVLFSDAGDRFRAMSSISGKARYRTSRSSTPRYFQQRLLLLLSNFNNSGCVSCHSLFLGAICLAKLHSNCSVTWFKTFEEIFSHSSCYFHCT